MTRADAIDIINSCVQADTEEANEALDMAIEALEQESKSEWLEHEDDKHLKEIQDEAHGSLNALMATLYNKGYQDGAKALVEHHKLCRDEADGTDNVLDKIRKRIELEKLGYPPSAGYYKAIMKVLQIIDKFKAGSEE